MNLGANEIVTLYQGDNECARAYQNGEEVWSYGHKGLFGWAGTLTVTAVQGLTNLDNSEFLLTPNTVVIGSPTLYQIDADGAGLPTLLNTNTIASASAGAGVPFDSATSYTTSADSIDSSVFTRAGEEFTPSAWQLISKRFNMCIARQLMVSAGRTDVCQLIDISGASPVNTSLGFSGDISISEDGTYAYYGEYRTTTPGLNMFEIIDGSTVGETTSIPLVDINLHPESIRVYRDRLYIMASLDRIEIYDISTPSTPVYLGGTNNVDLDFTSFTYNGSQTIQFWDNIMFVLERATIRSYDISNPNNVRYIAVKDIANWVDNPDPQLSIVGKQLVYSNGTKVNFVEIL